MREVARLGLVIKLGAGTHPRQMVKGVRCSSYASPARQVSRLIDPLHCQFDVSPGTTDQRSRLRTRYRPFPIPMVAESEWLAIVRKAREGTANLHARYRALRLRVKDLDSRGGAIRPTRSNSRVAPLSALDPGARSG
jgi:hypothetical protein